MLKWIEIDLKVIKNNARAVKNSLKPGVGLMAVVKAGGYGHGALETAKAALAGGAGMLGVLTLEEGLALRKQGVKAPIAALSPAPASYAREFVRAGIIPTADSLAFIRELDARAPKGRKTPYYIDIDSGLKSWGVDREDFPAFSAGDGPSTSTCKSPNLAVTTAKD